MMTSSLRWLHTDNAIRAQRVLELDEVERTDRRVRKPGLSAKTA